MNSPPSKVRLSRGSFVSVVRYQVLSSAVQKKIEASVSFTKPRRFSKVNRPPGQGVVHGTGSSLPPYSARMKSVSHSMSCFCSPELPRKTLIEATGLAYHPSLTRLRKSRKTPHG